MKGFARTLRTLRNDETGNIH